MTKESQQRMSTNSIHTTLDTNQSRIVSKLRRKTCLDRQKRLPEKMEIQDASILGHVAIQICKTIYCRT